MRERRGYGLAARAGLCSESEGVEIPVDDAQGEGRGGGGGKHGQKPRRGDDLWGEDWCENTNGDAGV